MLPLEVPLAEAEELLEVADEVAGVADVGMDA